MLSSSTRTSGTITPPAGAAADSVAVSVTAPPSATVAGAAPSDTAGRASAFTVTDTDGTRVDAG